MWHEWILWRGKTQYSDTEGGHEGKRERGDKHAHGKQWNELNSCMEIDVGNGEMFVFFRKLFVLCLERISPLTMT